MKIRFSEGSGNNNFTFLFIVIMLLYLLTELSFIQTQSMTADEGPIYINLFLKTQTGYI